MPKFGQASPESMKNHRAKVEIPAIRVASHHSRRDLRYTLVKKGEAVTKTGRVSKDASKIWFLKSRKIAGLWTTSMIEIQMVHPRSSL
jgi:hypothetical protein